MIDDILSDGYMPQSPLTLDEYKAVLGRVVGQSDWIQLDQSTITEFAQLTGDNQYIHVDPERARGTPLGGTVAHGFLTLAVIGGLGPKSIPPIPGTRIGYNYGFDRIRFIAPVPSGSQIRATFSAKDAQSQGRGTLLKFDVVVEIKGQKRPALVAEWLVMMSQE